MSESDRDLRRHKLLVDGTLGATSGAALTTGGTVGIAALAGAAPPLGLLFGAIVAGLAIGAGIGALVSRREMEEARIGRNAG